MSRESLNNSCILQLLTEIGQDLFSEHIDKQTLNKQKHKLYHLWKDERCCKCKEDHEPKKLLRGQKTCLTKADLHKLFEKPFSERFCRPNFCICKFVAKSEIILDISLSAKLLTKVFEIPEKNAVLSIANLRNDHVRRKTKIENEQFEEMWIKATHAMLTLARHSYSKWRGIIANHRCKLYQTNLIEGYKDLIEENTKQTQTVLDEVKQMRQRLDAANRKLKEITSKEKLVDKDRQGRQKENNDKN